MRRLLWGNLYIIILLSLYCNVLHNMMKITSFYKSMRLWTPEERDCSDMNKNAESLLRQLLFCIAWDCNRKMKRYTASGGEQNIARRRQFSEDVNYKRSYGPTSNYCVSNGGWAATFPPKMKTYFNCWRKWNNCCRQCWWTQWHRCRADCYNRISKQLWYSSNLPLWKFSRLYQIMKTKNRQYLLES